MLTTFQRDAEIQRAHKAGAQGYLLKSMPATEMLETIRKVHSGMKSVPREIAVGLAEHFSDEALSEREVEVLNHVAEGNCNRDIGKKLFIAEDTVKVHLKRIMGKLGTHAVAIALRRGFIHL